MFRFVEDTITLVKNDNNLRFRSVKQFPRRNTEVEHNNKPPLLDVLLIENTNNIDTTVYTKPTNTNIYLNWNLHAPSTWRRGTLIHT